MVSSILAIVFCCVTVLHAESVKVSDEEIIKAIIYKSIATHRGECACPYERTTEGNKCGRQSAYVRGGSYKPLCYASDVTTQMIDEFRASMH